MNRLPTLLLLAGCLLVRLAEAQDVPSQRPAGMPITVTLFAESISLPTFRNIQKGGLGIRLGTEFYYRQRPGSQVLQTLNVGYYVHPNVQNGLFVSSEFGYRKFIGGFFVDATIGGGALLVRPSAPSYTWDETNQGLRKAPANQLKFMPSLGLGAGYRFRNRTTVFTRYELFGEMPFGQILLPHQAIHLGTRLMLEK